MPARLSSPLSSLQPHYAVVVIGSGYGGAIAASRLARAGKRVCVLERGQELQPGEYPDTQLEIASHAQVDAAGVRVGTRTGLFDFRVNEDISVLIGCGLGGTSLINGNVAIRAEPRVFFDERWPKALREDIAGMELGYTLAEQMLKPARYPRGQWPKLAKLDGLEQSAKAMGARFDVVPINVNFDVEGENHVGVGQRPCTLCGDCVSGCNHSAKNTTLMNYLPDAKNHGAELFTQVWVSHLSREQGKWVVHYQALESGREAFDAPTSFITADVVVLGAGTLGSTELLLRSRERGLPVSARLGERFSGNGDVLGVGYNCDQPVHGVGAGHRPLPPNGVPPGPCITGVLDAREKENLDEGLIVEEGVIPGALAPILPVAYAAQAKLIGTDTDTGVADAIQEAARQLQSLVGGAYVGAMQSTQTYLLMTHDGAGGRMVLKEDRLRIEWPKVAEQPFVERANQTLLDATRAQGGTFIPNPITALMPGKELLTVHPLGGCCMGEDAERGVVNHKGQVFAGTAGTAVHEGLYVTDAAVIPRPLGVNPLLTISALAERSCALLAKDRGWQIDYALPSRPKAPPAPPKLAIQFTETMAGHISTRVLSDFLPAEAQGKEDRSSFRFVLTVAYEDLEATLARQETPGRVTGTVEAPALSPKPLAVAGGSDVSFTREGCEAGVRRLVYRMALVSEEGKRWHLEGFKHVHDGPGTVLDLWTDTTTVYVTLRENDATGPVTAKGVLRMNPADFLAQLGTLQVFNARDVGERLSAVARFGELFAGQLWEIYGGVRAKHGALAQAAPRKRRTLRAPAPEVYAVPAEDGVKLRLARYRAGEKGPVLLGHDLGVSGQIFTLDTLETNLVEFLCAHGYDVWVLDHRASVALPVSQTAHSADDVARYDWPAAVRKVRSVTGRASVQVVAHGYGALTLSMSLLAGLTGVRSAVLSQVGAHADVPFHTALKSGLHVPEVLEALGVESLSAYAGGAADWVERLFEVAGKVQPAEEGDRCDKELCRRVAFMYGVPYDHRNLDDATHAALHEVFGVASVRAFEHLARMVREGRAVDFDGADRYLPHPERLRLPLALIGGGHNRCFLPSGLQRTYDWLVEENGASLYTRHVVPGYGHLDCILGKDAFKDVYPYIVSHLDTTQAERPASLEPVRLPKVTRPQRPERPAPPEKLPVPAPTPLPPVAHLPPPPVAVGVEVPGAFITLFRVAAFSNALFALGFLFAQERLTALLGMPPLNPPLVGWLVGAFVGVFAVMLWDLSDDVAGKLQLIRYGTLEKAGAALLITAAYLSGQVPLGALLLSAVGDIVWIPIFIGIGRSMARRIAARGEGASALPRAAA